MSLSDGTTSITLPDDLRWDDEFKWAPIAQTVNYGLTGALFVEEGAKQAGRPITLTAHDDMAWVDRETAQALITMAAVTDKEMTLTITEASTGEEDPGREIDVMFRRHDGEPIELEPVKGFGIDDDFIVRAIRLMEI